MAGNLTDYAEKKILDHSLGTTTWTKPTAVYIALFTTQTQDNGSGTEVTGGSYARQAATFDAATLGAGTTQNALDITFPVATADWGTISHLAIFDAVTAGNMIWQGPLTTSKQIQNGDQFLILDSDLDLALD